MISYHYFEGCLSVPGVRGVVERHLEIEVSGFDRHGEHHSKTIRGYSAGTYQHEADHLDGVLFPHRLKTPQSLCSWGIFKAYHEAEFVKTVEGLVREFGA